MRFFSTGTGQRSGNDTSEGLGGEMQTVTGAMEEATRLFDWATDFNSAVTVTLGAARLGSATGDTAAGATANFGSRGLFDSIKTDFGFE